jgi:hypothetical protein|tara:strand:- start:182 stop:346 length:165 start_codon:yes stop_codon:yes gene_type:complete
MRKKLNWPEKKKLEEKMIRHDKNEKLKKKKSGMMLRENKRLSKKQLMPKLGLKS